MDAMLKDSEKLLDVNAKRHKRYHVDWRVVIALRFQSEVFDPEKSKLTFVTWKNLAKKFKVPMGWMERHCSQRLQRAIIANDGSAFRILD